MPKKDPRVDKYIQEAAEFAKPILKHLRKLVHTGCPEVEETLKWGMPAFVYKGIVCGMAAFKQHCTFGFWKHSLLFTSNKREEEGGMGQFGRITALKDLPADKVLLDYIKEAARLNEEGIKVVKAPKRKTAKPVVVPHDLASGLEQNKKAQQTFASFSLSHQREYVEWLTEAKREETRLKRLETTLAWLAEGKPRNWKYMNC
jgi:uncharacterized protein YdeI (YjbR/CyaY-like superfamily)